MQPYYTSAAVLSAVSSSSSRLVFFFFLPSACSSDAAFALWEVRGERWVEMSEWVEGREKIAQRTQREQSKTVPALIAIPSLGRHLWSLLELILAWSHMMPTDLSLSILSSHLRRLTLINGLRGKEGIPPSRGRDCSLTDESPWVVPGFHF